MVRDASRTATVSLPAKARLTLNGRCSSRGCRSSSRLYSIIDPVLHAVTMHISGCRDPQESPREAEREEQLCWKHM